MRNKLSSAFEDQIEHQACEDDHSRLFLVFTGGGLMFYSCKHLEDEGESDELNWISESIFHWTTNKESGPSKHLLGDDDQNE